MVIHVHPTINRLNDLVKHGHSTSNRGKAMVTHTNAMGVRDNP